MDWPALRLPLEVDPGPLADEVRSLPDEAWVAHFNRRIYTGDWSAVALRSLGGELDRIYPGIGEETTWAPTRWLAACPATAAVLERFACPVESARFLRLGPGARLEPHNDPGLGYQHGECRLHIPVMTDDRAWFRVDGTSVVMGAGECWYLNADLMHEAANDGVGPRVHLVLDCRRDPWLDALFADDTGA